MRDMPHGVHSTIFLPRLSPPNQELATIPWLVAGAALLSLATVIASIFGPSIALYVLALTVGFVCVMLSVSGPRALLAFIIFVSGTAGGMSSIEGLTVGNTSVTLSGLTTALIVAGTTVSIYCHRGLIRGYWFRDLLPFWLFGVIACLRCFGSSAGVDGWRQAFLIVAPLLVSLLTSIVLTLDPSNLAWIESAFVLSAIVAILTLVCTVSIGLIESSPQGYISIFGRRSLALCMMIMLVFGLAHWRFGASPTKRTLGFSICMATLAVILTSLSRTTSVVALMFLLPFRFINVAGRSFFSLLRVFFVGTAMLGLLLLWAPVRERFLGEGSSLGDARDVSSSYADLNTSGRDLMWAATFEDSLDAPTFGHGTGTASKLVEVMVPGLDHPHNDYLRVFHDQGLIGLAIFIWAWAGQAFRKWKAWASSDRVPILSQKYRMIGFLVAVSITLSFLTDNLMIYEYMMMPSYILLVMSDFVERAGNRQSH